jgi:hypothetical protein
MNIIQLRRGDSLSSTPHKILTSLVPTQIESLESDFTDDKLILVCRKYYKAKSIITLKQNDGSSNFTHWDEWWGCEWQLFPP